MEKISDETRAEALEILMASLKDIPGVLRIIKQDTIFVQRLRAFCEFCVDIAMLKDGAYLTSDHNGVALFFNSRKKAPFFPFLFAYLKLGHRVIGWKRVPFVLWKQRIIARKRCKLPHLHFWILGVKDNSFGLKTIIEIRDFTYALSAKLGLPILAETRMERTLRLYQRYGFQCYNEWKSESESSTVYFLKREPL